MRIIDRNILRSFMNPNDPQQPVPNTTPQPITPAEASFTPQPAPVAPLTPVAPLEPVAANPFATDPQLPVQPPAPIGTFGGTDPTQPLTPKTSRKKLFIIIGAAVAGVLILAGVAVLLLVPFNGAGSAIISNGTGGGNASILDPGLSLKTYKGDTFSVDGPADYTSEPSDGGVVFTQPDVASTDASKVIVGGLPYSSSTKADYLKLVDDSLTVEKLEKSNTATSSIKNAVISKDNINGYEARSVVADSYENDKKTGTIRTIYFFGEKKAYLFIVAIKEGTPGLAASTNKMVASFKINE
ncbi:MAG: hypothetical protein JWM52_750 [Candidatus Saccharibacteria bacterium]|nr:hypothetical protein [Candidatus Saccharibacteria bacterium]